MQNNYHAFLIKLLCAFIKKKEQHFISMGNCFYFIRENINKMNFEHQKYNEKLLLFNIIIITPAHIENIYIRI